MIMSQVETSDVLVIGGGPAGATTATLLGKQGHRVTLLERERFPRFHIGESLIPETYHVLEKLGMLPKMKQSQFVKKVSVQFVTDKGYLSEPFYFMDHKPHEASQTWQVTRAEFDQMMLANAVENGVTVHEGTRVTEVLFDGERAVGCRTMNDQGESRQFNAQVVVDASGQGTVIASRLGLRQWDAELKKAAVWSYYEGAFRDTGKNEGATIVMQTAEKKGWFWYIPLHNNITSVGVVAGFDYLFKDRATKDHEALFEEEISRCPGVIPRLEGAKRVAPIRVAKEYSYRAKQVSGDGWVLVGDAYGFLDPLYSSGVLLALKSGDLAAEAIDAGLRKGDTSKEALGAWEEEYVKGMNRMRRLVIEFYDGMSFGKLVKKNPHIKGHITDLLIGDLFDARLDEVIAPMDELRKERESMMMSGTAEA